MRLAWLTDIHLKFLAHDFRQGFLEAVRDRADSVFISGDIGESHTIEALLGEMEATIQKPIYFVLGNHDFYFSDDGTTWSESLLIGEPQYCQRRVTSPRR